MDTIISQPIIGSPMNLSIRREGGGSHVVSANWKNPKSATSGGFAANWIGRQAFFHMHKGPSLSTAESLTTDIGTTSWSIDMSNCTDKDGQRITRASFYPISSRTLSDITIAVWYRRHGNGGVKLLYEGATEYVWLKFRPPRKPSISKATHSQNGHVSFTVTTDAGNDSYERYDTEWEMTVYDAVVAEGRTKFSHTYYGSNTSTSFTLAHDITYQGQLGYSGVVKIIVKARARGYAGNSDWATREFVVCAPEKPTIRRLDYCSESSGYGRVTAILGTLSTSSRPADGVKMEVLRNTTAATAADAILQSGWAELAGAVDDGECAALSAMVSELQPDVGNHTWLRVKSWHSIESMFYRYSDAVEAKKLFKPEPPEPTAADDNVAIAEAVSIEERTGARLKLLWNADDSTGTEISWSKHSDAWVSNEAPQVWNYVSGATVSETNTFNGNTYNRRAYVFIRGLEPQEGESVYYFRARRYREGDGGTTYGRYARLTMPVPWVSVQVIEADELNSVSLLAPSTVMFGKPLPLSWRLDTEARQLSYQIVTGSVVTTTDEHGSPRHTIADSQRKVIDTAQGSKLVCNVPASRVARFASDGSLWVAVMVEVRGRAVTSDAVKVSVLTKPTGSVAVPEVLSQQPLPVSLTTSDESARAQITITSKGCRGIDEILLSPQIDGDTVWSGLVKPEWSDGAATYTVPAGLDLRDGAEYGVSVRLTDSLTGVSSDVYTAEFGVEYERSAPEPADAISVAAYDETDEYGIRARYAVVSLAAGDLSQTDLYDVYRVGANGPQLIASGCPQTASVTDRFCPFGDGRLAYRVVARTEDGDRNWADYEYEFGSRGYTGGEEVRVDFGKSYFECDRAVSMQASYKKDFTAVSYLDAREQEGYWGTSVGSEHTASGTLVKVAEQEQIARLMELARYSGPCFVRMSDGSAFAANVEVSPVSQGTGSAGKTFSLKMTSVIAGDEFAAEVD